MQPSATSRRSGGEDALICEKGLCHFGWEKEERFYATWWSMTSQAVAWEVIDLVSVIDS